jgi:hypothetical protein
MSNYSRIRGIIDSNIDRVETNIQSLSSARSIIQGYFENQPEAVTARRVSTRHKANLDQILSNCIRDYKPSTTRQATRSRRCRTFQSIGSVIESLPIYEAPPPPPEESAEVAPAAHSPEILAAVDAIVDGENLANLATGLHVVSQMEDLTSEEANQITNCQNRLRALYQQLTQLHRLTQ